MSAVFEHFGQNPVSFVIAKNVILVLLFGGITLAWGMLGQRLGVFQRSVQAKADPQQRIDENVIEEATDKITFAINQVLKFTKACASSILCNCKENNFVLEILLLFLKRNFRDCMSF